MNIDGGRVRRVLAVHIGVWDTQLVVSSHGWREEKEGNTVRGAAMSLSCYRVVYGLKMMITLRCELFSVGDISRPYSTR